MDFFERLERVLEEIRNTPDDVLLEQLYECGLPRDPEPLHYSSEFTKADLQILSQSC